MDSIDRTLITNFQNSWQKIIPAITEYLDDYSESETEKLQCLKGVVRSLWSTEPDKMISIFWRRFKFSESFAKEQGMEETRKFYFDKLKLQTI